MTHYYLHLLKKQSQNALKCSLLFVALIMSCTQGARAQIITTFAGNGGTTPFGDGFAATTSSVQPMDVALDAAGNVYIADYTRNRIRKVSTSGIMTTIAGNDTAGYSGDGGPATAAKLNDVRAIAADLAGNMYIADYGNHRIRKINSTGIITTIAGTGINGINGDLGPATAAQVGEMAGIAVDKTGNIYFTDFNIVRKINTSGIVTFIAGDGRYGRGGDGGPATAAQVYVPSHITVDPLGNIYFTERDNSIVRKINTSGIISTYAGGGTSYGDGGPAPAAWVATPYGIASDEAGNIYFISHGNLRKINTLGNITTVAGTGTAGYSGDGGPATAAQLTYPVGLAIDKNGSVYVADLGAYRLRVVTNPPNHAPVFTGGRIQAMTVCQNYVDSINSLLTVVDSDAAAAWQSNTWSLASAPLHGTISANYTTAVTGSALSPHNLYYTPVYGYAGTDSFKIRVTDGINSDTTTIRVTFLTSPVAITGATGICPGISTTLSDATGGGTWSSAAGTASVGSSTGVVTGVTPGTAMISYTIGTGCAAAIVMNIISTSSITGNMTACVGTTFALSNPAGAGIWTTSNSTVASIGSSSGILTGLTVGTSTISFATSTGCFAYRTETVTVLPAAITGPNYLLKNVTATLNITTTGGIWSSSDNSIVSVNSATGIVTGINEGSTTINYVFPGCAIHAPMTVMTKGPLVTAFAGDNRFTYLGDGVPATSTPLHGADDVVMDEAGNVYIADYFNFRIRKVDVAGIITTVAGTGTSGFSGDGGPATAAQISQPTGLAWYGGNLYFVDAVNKRIRKISATGTITTIAGNGTAGFAGDGGPATAARLGGQGYITIDGAGNIYMADQLNRRIRKINSSGDIYTIAGTGSSTASGDNGPAVYAGLSSPTYIYADRTTGNLYLCDNSYSSIRMIDASGIITSIVGTTTAGYWGDGGPATGAHIKVSNGICKDAEGNLIFVDGDNDVLRKVDANNIITTIVSSIRGAGICADTANNIYVADFFGSRVWKVAQNHIPFFTTGHVQNLELNRNSGLYRLDTLLRVTDYDTGQAIRWNVIRNPAHGTAALSYASASARQTLLLWTAVQKD